MGATLDGRMDPGGAGASGGTHYPDLILLVPAGRAAIELELEPTAPDRLEEIIVAYESKTNIAGVKFLVENPELAKPAQAAATRLGVSFPVSFEWIRFDRSGR